MWDAREGGMAHGPLEVQVEVRLGQLSQAALSQRGPLPAPEADRAKVAADPGGQRVQHHLGRCRVSNQRARG